MKEEYLWNKTGSDPEIERLENALQAFRYQADEPPALPAKTLSLKREPRRFSFKLVFVTMALGAAAFIFTGAWLQLPDDKIEIAGASSETAEAPILEATAAESLIAKLPDTGNAVVPATIRADLGDKPRTAIRRTEMPFPAKFPKVIRKNRRLTTTTTTTTTTANPDDWIADNSKIKNPAIKLTKEESYAYNRLLLALSITSSKLKLVTDKIQGVEEGDIVSKIEQ